MRFSLLLNATHDPVIFRWHHGVRYIMSCLVRGNRMLLRYRISYVSGDVLKNTVYSIQREYTEGTLYSLCPNIITNTVHGDFNTQKMKVNHKQEPP